MCDSFSRLVGRPLILDAESPAALAAWLYDKAPFGLLAHDAEIDPRFTYANKTAQRAFEYNWDEFTCLRSRLSTEPDRREDRDRLLEAVAQRGFVEGYRGVRISKSGRRFWVEDVTMWNLVDDDGIRRGQAAVFLRWPDA
jgi:PAS domain-containing protein